MAYNDRIFEYATELLSLGPFYVIYCDAIKEGDGDLFMVYGLGFRA